MERRKLTDDEVAKLDSEQRSLKDVVERQCSEQVAFLKQQIHADDNLRIEEKNYLIGGLNNGGWKVSLFRVTDSNVDKKLVVQVVYSVDDELEAYLRKPADQLPPKLRNFLDHGIALQMDKPVAVDTMPQIGKTKIR